MKAILWTKKERIRLQAIAKKGYSLAQIADAIGKTRHAVTQELKKGVDAEDWAKRSYVGYSPKKSVIKQIEKYLGDSYEFVQNDLNKDSEDE